MDPRDFPFIEPPPVDALVAALESLEHHGATIEVTAGAAGAAGAGDDHAKHQLLPVLGDKRPREHDDDDDNEEHTVSNMLPSPPKTQLHCTALGHALALLPVDLSTGKMLLLSAVRVVSIAINNTNNTLPNYTVSRI